MIPCYNEGERLGEFLRQLSRLAAPYDFIDIVVVDDGSSPGHVQTTRAIVNDLQTSSNSRLSLQLQTPNQGKGAALAAGFGASQSAIVGFVDADGATSAEECMRLLAKFIRLRKGLGRPGAPIPAAILGSRIKMLGMTVDRHMRRHYMGRVFATLLSMMFRIPVYDSQCGCKFFWMESARPLLPFVTSQRWLWDTQLTILFFMRGIPMLEEPVSWKDAEGSKVSMLRDPLRMTMGLVRFRRQLERSGFFRS